MPDKPSIGMHRLAPLLLVALLACGDGKSPTGPGKKDGPPRPTTLSLSSGALTFAAIGDSARLTAEVKDQQGGAMATAIITWASTDTTVATVDGDGWVTAVANGSAMVVARSGALADTAAVEIEQVPDSIEVSPDPVGVIVGDTHPLEAMVIDANGVEIDEPALTWTSEDTTIATVDDAGLLTGLAPGETRIVASAGEVADTVVALISAQPDEGTDDEDPDGEDPDGGDPGGDGPGGGDPGGGDPGGGDPDDEDSGAVPATVVAEPDTVALLVGRTAALSAVVRDSDGAEMTDVELTWSSEDETVATVDGAGLVTGVGEGETLVVATAGEVGDTVVVMVKRPIPAEIEISPELLAFAALGDSIHLAAVVRDGDGDEIEGESVTWSSTDPAVARVTNTGWVVAVDNGVARVVAAVGEVADTISVEVEQLPAALRASPKSLRLGEGDTHQLTAVVLDANDHPIAGAAITWKSTSGANVSVDATGLVKALNRGLGARVIASSGALSDTVSVGTKHQIAVTTATGFALINDDGTGFREIGGKRGHDPTWSPAGNKLAYLSFVDSPGSTLFMLDEVDGTGTPRFVAYAQAAQFVRWSSKGKILFDYGYSISNRKIVVVNADGTGELDVVPADNYENSHPAWSPDGKQFVYTSQRDSAHLIIANDDGTDKRTLVKARARFLAPVWTIGGKEIIYTRFSSSIYTLHRVDVATGVSRELGPGRYPERASSGNLIAAIDKNAESGLWELYIYDLNANTMKTHIFSREVTDRPLWSPDNRRILVASGNSLLIYDLESDEEVTLTVPGMDLHMPSRSFSWRPPKPLEIVEPVYPWF